MSTPAAVRSAREAGRQAASAPRGCSCFKLRQLSRRVSQHFDRIVGETGLKTTQYSLLSNLERLGPVRLGELAHAMALEPSTLTRNLQPLVKLGWAEVGPGPDGRSREASITSAGRAKRAEAQRSWKRAQLDLNERLGAERVAHLHALLEECLDLMKTHAEPQEGDTGDLDD